MRWLVVLLLTADVWLGSLGKTAIDVDTEYGVLSEALHRAGVVPAPAELHGEICGVMCSAGRPATDSWLDEALKECGGGTNEVREKLRELETDTWRMLTGADMTFEPLLPDEEWPLARQVEALASWCHGFLTGLGLGGFEREAAHASEELTEIVSDLAEISRAELSEDETAAPEESAFALAEVKEYVRVGVQIVFEELAAGRAAREKGTLH